jgi:hypothetical protein
MPEQPDNARSKGDEFLRRLLGPRAAPLPVVLEPDASQDLPEEPLPSEEPDWLAGLMRKTGASREELEEEARELGF